ncbi:hypothetical protein RB600_006424 [Gaeumannomyces tritici]
MDPPFKIERLPDMRESAGRVRFSARDMTPVEERGGLWRLPMSHLPLLQPVALLYNRDYFNTIVVAQAKARGLSITFDHGLECLWVENALVPSKGQMLVIIVLPKPLEPQAARVPVPRGMETLIHEEPRSTQTEIDGDQVEGAIAIKNLRKNPTIYLSKPKASTDSKAITLSADFKAVTPEREFQPINLQTGDILQLYENDGIHVTDGGIAIMAVRYKTEELHDQ